MKPSITLDHLEPLAKAHAAARDKLHSRLQRLADETAATKRRLLPGIKAALQEATASKRDLESYVSCNPENFVKPKSFKLHGLQIGYRKKKGKTVLPANLIARIKKLFPQKEQQMPLIQVEEKPVAKAVEQLPANTLKRLGVEVIGAGDETFVKPLEADLDKLIKRILDASEMPKAQE